MLGRMQGAVVTQGAWKGGRLPRNGMHLMTTHVKRNLPFCLVRVVKARAPCLHTSVLWHPRSPHLSISAMLASLRQLLGPAAQACTACAEPTWNGASAAARGMRARALSHWAASTSASAAEQALERVHIPAHEVEEGQRVRSASPGLGLSPCMEPHAMLSLLSTPPPPPAATPPAADLPQLTARVRDPEHTGSSASFKLRRAGRTPGQIDGLPGNRALAVAFDTTEAARHVRCPPPPRPCVQHQQ